MHSFLPCVYCVLRPCTRICIPVSLLRAQAAWPARHATSLRSLTRLLALTNSDYEQGNTARVGQLDTHIYVHTRERDRAHTAQCPDSKQSPQLQDGGSTASIAAAAITEEKKQKDRDRDGNSNSSTGSEHCTARCTGSARSCPGLCLARASDGSGHVWRLGPDRVSRVTAKRMAVRP